MGKKITEDGEVIDEVTHKIVARAPIYFKTPWNHDRDAESASTALVCLDPSKTQQQFAAEADINNILRKFMNGAELPLTGEARYQHIEELADLQDVIVTGYQVDQAWSALPSSVRNILKDPNTFVKYVEHCLETGDIGPLRELGLANPVKQTEASPAPTKPEGGTPAPEGKKAAPAASKAD